MGAGVFVLRKRLQILTVIIMESAGFEGSPVGREQTGLPSKLAPLQRTPVTDNHGKYESMDFKVLHHHFPPS